MIELLVVILIFMILTGVTIFSYGKFNSSLSSQNLADDIALSVRRAQGYAIGVRGYNSIFSEGYGVHFSTNPMVSTPYIGSTKSFVLFADMPGGTTNKYNYDVGICGSPTGTEECIEFLSIPSSDLIDQISYTYGSQTGIIPNTGTLDIMFRRPNLEPSFYCRDSSGSLCTSEIISSVEIRISSPSSPGSYKMITVANNGQISVENINEN